MVEAQLTGIFPRSNELIRATRNYDKGLIGREDLLQYIRRDAEDAIRIQRENGFRCVIDGMFLWQDIFRPFTEIVEGIEAGALTRWFDNNTFFRKPVIGDLEPKTHAPGLNRYIFLDLMGDGCKKVILPGLYTFASLSSRGYSEELIYSLAEIMAVEIKDLSSRGITVFQFNEPSLVYRKPSIHEDTYESLKIAYQIVKKASSSTIILHTYFGDVVPAIPHLDDFPVDYIGVDFYATEFMELKEYSLDKGLLCGCVDSRNSYLESPEKIRELMEKIEEHISPKDIILAPNCDLEFLTKELATKKIEVLKEAVNLLGGR